MNLYVSWQAVDREMLAADVFGNSRRIAAVSERSLTHPLCANTVKPTRFSDISRGTRRNLACSHFQCIAKKCRDRYAGLFFISLHKTCFFHHPHHEHVYFNWDVPQSCHENIFQHFSPGPKRCEGHPGQKTAARKTRLSAPVCAAFPGACILHHNTWETLQRVGTLRVTAMSNAILLHREHPV